MAIAYDNLACDGPYCLYIHAADDPARPRPWELPQRRLAHYLLVLSLDGDERLVVDGRTHVVAEGASYLIQPDTLCNLGSQRGNRPVWVHFDVAYDPRRGAHPYAGPYDAELGARAAWLQPDAHATWGLDLPVLVPPALIPLFRERLPRIVTTWRRGGVASTIGATHELAGLLLALVEHAATESSDVPVDSAARLARAENAALRVLDGDFGVAEFAAAAGLSRSRFSALFAAARGMGPATWLRRQRLLRAEQLLERPELPIGTVGALAGFPDPTVFGRIWRAARGCSPSAWRDRAQARRRGRR